jgi:hypothetical protein
MFRRHISSVRPLTSSKIQVYDAVVALGEPLAYHPEDVDAADGPLERAPRNRMMAVTAPADAGGENKS